MKKKSTENGKCPKGQVGEGFRKILLSMMILSLLIIGGIAKSNAQGVSINGTGAKADTSAMFDVASSTKGVLISRMSTTQRNAIALPAVGLTIYNTTTNCFNTYNGSTWTDLCGTCDFTPSVAGNSISGTTLNLTATTVSGATYFWTGPNNFTSSTQNPSISNVTSANAGTYYLTTTVGGCASAPSTTMVTIAAGNMVFTMSLNGNSATYNGSSWSSGNPIKITLTFVSGTTSGVGFTLTNLPDGTTYQLNPGGCFPTCNSYLTFLTPGTTSGTYTCTLTATGGGQSQSANITLNITAPSNQLNANLSSMTHVQTFTTSGSWTAPAGVTSVAVLVVGGGGSGGMRNTTNANGGGGAGGLIFNSSYSVTPGNTYNVTVGAGGAATGDNTNAVGNNGQNSAFDALTAIGGGGGGGSGSGSGRTGGSGGGGAYYYQNPGSGNQPGGYANSGGYGNYNWTGGGGGGASETGHNGNECGNCYPSGNGGKGYFSNISGSMIGYAGGGGGGGNSSEHAGWGFYGGGRGVGQITDSNGNVVYNYDQSGYIVDETNSTTFGHSLPSGLPNTGGGGGGGSYWAGSAAGQSIWTSGGGAGGSGIVVVRW